jgi:hypothetical protein
VIAVAAWIVGPAPTARRLREGVQGRLARDDGATPTTSRPAPWVHPVQGVVVALGLIVLAALDHPGAGAVLVTAGVVLVVVVVLQMFAPNPLRSPSN